RSPLRLNCSNSLSNGEFERVRMITPHALFFDSHRSVGEIRFVLCVGFAFSFFDIDPTGWDYSLFNRKPNLVEIARFGQGAEAVETLTTLVEKIYPGA